MPTDITHQSGAQPPEGLYYIPQENYYLANLSHPSPKRPETYLYSDSATSCIIVIVTGSNRSGEPIVALSHLGSTPRFFEFFRIVSEQFNGPVSLYAQGANPPSNQASMRNTSTLLQWILQHSTASPESPWNISTCTLSLGQGIPQHNNQDCYGIDLKTLQPSNQRFALTNPQRDPTGGLQTLYCFFGMNIDSPIPLLRSDQTLPIHQEKQLVQKARLHQWTNLLDVSDNILLNQLSSTPEYEVPWFVEVLKQSAEFVRDYALPKEDD